MNIRIYFKRCCLIFVCLLWFGTLILRAADRYVATNGTDSGTCENWSTAASNIQYALNLATNAYDTVWVSNGVYQTGGVTNWPAGSVLTNRIAITTAYVTVRSANNDPANTIIKGVWDSVTTNGASAVRGVYMISGSSLIGFTITNCATLSTNVSTLAENLIGGGLYASGGTISNCVIINNRSAGETNSYNPKGGGGAYGGTYFNCTLIGNSTIRFGGAARDATVFSNCTIACNSANGGCGGVYAGSLYNCVVISNTATGLGGGSYSCSLLYNCTFAYNVASSYGGGAMYPTLARNCLFYGNKGGAVALCTGNKIESCTIVGNSSGVDNSPSQAAETNIVLNSIIYSNETFNWYQRPDIAYFAFSNSCTSPTNSAGWVGAGNTTNNPVLVDFGTGYGTNHVKGNYRLAPSSPCINAGIYQSWMTNWVDLDGRTRIRYGRVDMGAYERINRCTMCGFH